MSFTWGKITDTDPLRVRLDGDSTALPFTPDSLVDPLLLAVDDRVRCEMSGGRVVVVGRQDGFDVEAFHDLIYPVGQIVKGHWVSAPDRFLKCDGAVVNIADYPRLAALFESIHGASNRFGGDGVTTFATPDMGDYVPVGVKEGSTEFGTVGDTAGTKTHDHPLSDAGYAQISLTSPGGNDGVHQRHVLTPNWTPTRSNRITTTTGGGNSGSGTALAGSTDDGSSLQPSRAVLFVIKY